MKSYLNTLNERDRWALIGGAFCLGLYLFYLFLYHPLSNSVSEKSILLAEKTQTLDWMRQIQREGHSAKSKKVVDNGQLLTILATALKNNRTLNFPYQLQQTSSGDIQLSFERVPFKLFITWLAKIDEQYKILVKQLEVEKTDTPGVTHLAIILSA